MNTDVNSPKFGTEGSACFDICAYIKEDMEISVYDMSNHKIKRKPEWYDDGCNPKLIFRIVPADRVLIPTGLIFDIPKDHSVRLHPSGERIAQGELIKNYAYEIEVTKNVPEQTTNRVGGFGSTGVK